MPPTEQDGLVSLATTFLDNHRWLWAIVYSRLGDRAATEDVLQEVSLAAVQNDRKPREIDQMRAWLYQVAIKQVLLFQRREVRHRAKMNGYANSIGSSNVPLTIDHLTLGEDTDLVRRGLQEIKPSDRQVLLLKYHEDLTCREIASLLGVKETTIQTRLLRARRRLRQFLVASQNFASEGTSGQPTGTKTNA